MTEDGARRFNPVPLLAGVLLALALVIAAWQGVTTARAAAGRFVVGLARLDLAAVSATWQPTDQLGMLNLHHTVFGVSRALPVQEVVPESVGLDGIRPAFTVRVTRVPLEPAFEGVLVDVSMRLTLDGWRVGAYSTARSAR
jgi:hypothetical protein